MLKQKLIQGNMYLFEWNDTYSRSAWFSAEGIDENTIPRPLQSTVGFFVKKTDEWIIVCMQKNNHDGFMPWGDVCWIPKGVVKKITSL